MMKTLDEELKQYESLPDSENPLFIEDYESQFPNIRDEKLSRRSAFRGFRMLDEDDAIDDDMRAEETDGCENDD